jgi:hypothetical protein
MQKTFSGMMQRPTGNPFPVGMRWEVDGLDLRMAATLVPPGASVEGGHLPPPGMLLAKSTNQPQSSMPAGMKGETDGFERSASAIQNSRRLPS